MRLSEDGRVSLPTIVYEDEVMMAFDKPSGLLIAPDRWDKTRVNLMGLVHAKYGHGVANVHRLDADTSGVVLCAKTKPALDFLSGEFQSRMAKKGYSAIAAVLPAERAMKLTQPIVTRDAAGRPAEGFTVDLALGEDESNPGRMRIHRRRGGKPSVTEFRIQEWFGRYALMDCQPLTGRTHQIRLHLAAAGLPVLNDPFYGDPTVVLRLSDLKRGYKGREDEKPLLSRLALHARELTVRHPVTREPVTISAPLPHEFEVSLKYLRKFADEAFGLRSRVR